MRITGAAYVRDAARRSLTHVARLLRRSAEQETGRERVARTGRVDDDRVDGERSSRASSVTATQPRAP
jgi:hypothetical protein